MVVTHGADQRPVARDRQLSVPLTGVNDGEGLTLFFLVGKAEVLVCELFVVHQGYGLLYPGEGFI